jgi:hypothetical protein
MRSFARFCTPRRDTSFGRAWLVTANLKHYPESGRGGVTVVGPGEYLEGLEEGSREFEGK